MAGWFKKHFIPHSSNEHRPHVLRDYSARNIIALILLLEIFTFIFPVVANLNLAGNMAAVLPAVLGELTNQERISKNLQPLTENPLLVKAAQMKAEDMAARGYFAHTSPEGKTPWYWIELAGYKYQYAGENLAVNFSDSRDVTRAWLNSPTHKANIIKQNYTEIGTGIARGKYKGRNSIFVAQVYANPLPTESQWEPGTPSKSTTQPKNLSIKAKTPAVLGAEIENINPPDARSVNLRKEELRRPSTVELMMSSPRNISNVMLAAVFSVILVSLLLYILIKRKHHHRDLLANGLLMLAIAGGLLVANYQYSQRSMIITQGIDYALE